MIWHLPPSAFWPNADDLPGFDADVVVPFEVPPDLDISVAASTIEGGCKISISERH